MQLEEFDNMGPLLQRLNESRLHSRETFKDLPQQGGYVFYDGEKPVYIGRSSRQTISKRLQQHTNPGSRENQAVFAFRLLQERVGERTGHGAPLTRPQFAKKYDEEFTQAKKKVTSMKVRAIEITDPATRAVFEIYAAVALNTPHNSFSES